MRDLNEREKVSYLIYKMRQEEKLLVKRWGSDMPDIPAGEIWKIRQSLAWLQEKLKEILKREYGHVP